MSTVSPPTSEELVNRLVHITDHLCTTRNDPNGAMRHFIVATTDMIRARLEDNDLIIERLSAAAPSGQRMAASRPDERVNRERARADHLTVELEQLRARRRRRTWIGRIDLILLGLMFAIPLLTALLIAADILPRRRVEALYTRIRQRLTGTEPRPPMRTKPPSVDLDNMFIPVRAMALPGGKWEVTLRLKVRGGDISMKRDVYPIPSSSGYTCFPGGEPGVFVDQVSFETAADGRFRLAPRATLSGGVRPEQLIVRVESIRRED